MLDSDRKVDRNIYSDVVTHDGICLIDKTTMLKLIVSRP